jgi:hypothetical protein
MSHGSGFGEVRIGSRRKHYRRIQANAQEDASRVVKVVLAPHKLHGRDVPM